MDKTDAIIKLQRQIDEIRKVKATARFGPTFEKWQRDTRVALSKIFINDERPAKDFADITYHPLMYTDSTQESAIDRVYLDGLEQAEAYLESCIREIDEYWDKEAALKEGDPFVPIIVVEKLCSRFHLLAMQLKNRFNKRKPIVVNDEYDFQYLLFGILKIFFVYVRQEEVTPSFAGKSARMDFLLKDCNIVIETKMARKGLGAKEIGTQLIDDIARYKQHPECKTLVCFVYNPAEVIENPAGLEKDLSTEHNGFSVKVIIAPKGH
jgi:hypothetical protein